MRVALVHDYLREIGGAERVLAVLTEMFPDADVFTSYYHPDRVSGRLSKRKLRTTFIQSLPMLWQRPSFIDRLGRDRLTRSANAWVFLLPLVFRTLDLYEYDLIISDTAYCAHHVHKRRGQTHVSYCHTPARFVWQYPERQFPSAIKRSVWAKFIKFLRRLDVAAVARVDHLIVNSRTVQERVREYWARDSRIVYPPVDILERTGFRPTGSDDGYYLVVSRLDPLKRVQAIVEAFNGSDRKLIVVGTGTDDTNIAAIAGPNVTLTGFVPDEVLCKYYDRAKAVVIAAQDEDFGITAVEAQLFGKPVIAVKEGGFCETVIDGQTGLLFDFEGPASIAGAVERSEAISFNPQRIRENGDRFSKEAFIQGFRTALGEFGIPVPRPDKN